MAKLAIFTLLFPYLAGAAGTSRCPSDFTSQWKTKLVVHHLSVGQGDATFIRTPEGKTFLIDAGLPSQGRDNVLPVLKRCYLENPSDPLKINYLIVTHPHIDHFGGMREVFEAVMNHEVKADYILDTGSEIKVQQSQELDKYIKLRDTLVAKGFGKKTVPKPGGVLKSGSVVFTVVAVNGKVLGKPAVKVTNKKNTVVGENINSLSIAIKVRYGTFDYFIGGDLTGGGDSTPDIETHIAGAVGEVDVYHANHHGSNTSSSNKLLWTMKPKAVVVSVGDGGMNNRYQLPKQETIDRIRLLPSVVGIYMTAQGALKKPLSPKVHNESGDVVLVAAQTLYIVNQNSFKTDGK